MNIQTLLELLRNKISTLESQKNSAYMTGDIESFDKLTNEILEVEEIIKKLNS